MKPIIIDVREPFEFASGHARGAVNIPPAKFMDGTPRELEGVDTSTPLVLYCRSGSRSNSSMRFFEAMGFSDITNGINKEHVDKNYA